METFEQQLYTVNDQSFNDIALKLFQFQARSNPVYSAYIRYLGINPDKIRSVDHIPFLPIAFFKNQEVKTGTWCPETTFTSSGTTGTVVSRHPVKDLRFYLEHAEKCFEFFFGRLTDYHFLALLPSYLERKDSSLVAMIDHFITQSQSPYSGFYLHNTGKLLEDLEKLRRDSRKTILWGVSFALLDLAEQYSPDLSHCLIVETGGMKGRRKEIVRNELHSLLCRHFRVNSIYSEYGMTELFSQAYTRGGNTFFCPPWMKVLGRDMTDPLQKGLQNETAGLNIIDLANWHSISFIETADIGKVFTDGSFEVLGRMDNSDVRGCNLMVH